MLSFREYDIGMFKGEENMVIFDIGLSFGIGAFFKSVEKRKVAYAIARNSLTWHRASCPGILAPLSGLGLTVPHSQRGATAMVCGCFRVYTRRRESRGLSPSSQMETDGFRFWGSVQCLLSLEFDTAF